MFCFNMGISFISERISLTTLEAPSALSNFNEPKALVTILLTDPDVLDGRSRL